MKYFVCVLVLLVLSSVATSLPALGRNTQGGQIERDVICKLPAVRGHCRALLPRWRYNPEVGKCQQFKFGGCDGNGNNFMTEQQCMSACKGI